MRGGGVAAGVRGGVDETRERVRSVDDDARGRLGGGENGDATREGRQGRRGRRFVDRSSGGGYDWRAGDVIDNNGTFFGRRRDERESETKRRVWIPSGCR